MNQWTLHLFLPVVLLLAGCQPKPETFIPVTGDEKVSLPARVERTREHVMEYVLSSARLANLPPPSEWQFDTGQAAENEFRFRSGDWLMLIRDADLDAKNQQVMILNPVERAAWLGYVTPDGRVIDTTYRP